jgi:hypothetical protein
MTAFVRYYLECTVKAYKSALSLQDRFFLQFYSFVQARLPCIFKTVFCMPCLNMSEHV